MEQSFVRGYFLKKKCRQLCGIKLNFNEETFIYSGTRFFIVKLIFKIIKLSHIFMAMECIFFIIYIYLILLLILFFLLLVIDIKSFVVVEFPIEIKMKAPFCKKKKLNNKIYKFTLF